MSTLIARIKQIETVDHLNIVTFDFNADELKMMSLELSQQMQVGNKVALGVKPTSVAVAKSINGVLSYSNRLCATVASINSGKLLSSVRLSVHGAIIESIITRASADIMNLHVNDEVAVLINESDIFVLEVLE
ncbi:MAG: TOBE domain-containing protein [Campylobacterota bacterium]|nr:TOBE domain-containing protein [Campylobacterota bacterium]